MGADQVYFLGDCFKLGSITARPSLIIAGAVFLGKQIKAVWIGQIADALVLFLVSVATLVH
jgi:hypothetical protein